MDKNLILYHNDWYGECKIRNNTITRLDDESEKGTIALNKNTIEVYWEKWDRDYFIYIQSNIYIEKRYFNLNFHLLFLLKKKDYVLLPFNKIKYYFLYGNCDNYKINEYIDYQDEKYIYYLNTIYIHKDDLNEYFHLDTYNFNKKTTYILNKYSQKFFDIESIYNCGSYHMDNNILYLKWQNGNIKKYMSNSYHEENIINYENIKVIKPTKIMIHDRVLFSNISLVKNKVILSSIHYIHHPWVYDNIKIKIKNNKIIQKYSINYDHYESCFMLSMELENENKHEELTIEYESHVFNIDIYQLQLPEKEIYAMTLFKDDYQLTKKYMEYYTSLGVDCFIFYYISVINDTFLKELNMLNQSKYKIILVEWDYVYWWSYLSYPKHHHAQTMAINDALYILKDISSYILFNDLDEYIVFKDQNMNDIKTFKDLIQSNTTTDIFEFKCMFCKMGDKCIKYRNFYFEYDEKNIIKGNFWDKYREKNLIKTSSVNLMGIHNPIQKFSKKDFTTICSGYFNHFVNFVEKNRPELMTQYIS